PGPATTTWAGPEEVPGGGPVRQLTVMKKAESRQSALVVELPQEAIAGGASALTVPWKTPLWPPTASLAPPRLQTATRPGCAWVSGTLMVPRISSMVRATFHSRNSVTAPLGLKGYEKSPPISTGAVLAAGGPVTANGGW